ncbi:MAG: hypothetical protein CMJ33_09745 [Phycisphaerae bacterium]|nr:hypothetical protein [Phycisphaerae bacterium]HAW96831.1 hypothetical protein [Phycisphaerales bacterium]
MNRLKSFVLGMSLFWLCTATSAGLQAQTPDDWSDLGPNVVVQDQVRPIIESFDRYYRAQNTLMCKGEVRASLREGEFNEVMFLSARAKRPNLVEVAVIAENSMFPTDVFVSDGTDLFEQSILLRNYMISTVADDFQALHERVVARSAPNVPVEIITSLMSDSPMRNLLQIDLEPGLVRLLGVTEVNGVSCNELCVNELGTRVWVSKELPPRLMRYKSSPALMKPRYLPEGVIVRGPTVIVDFKSWAITEELDTPWDWATPTNSTRMATMHENAAGPGPETGYDAMLWEEGVERKLPGTPSLTRSNDSGNQNDSVLAPLKPGDKVPDVQLLDIHGAARKLDALRNDGPSVVVFWVTGGKFSRSSMPGIIRAARDSGTSLDVPIIPIGSPLTPAQVSGNRTMPDDLIEWCDAEGEAARRFGVTGRPALFFIDSNGSVIDSYVGPRPRFAARVPDLVKNLVKRSVKRSEEVDHEAIDDPSVDDDGDPKESSSSSM